MIPPDFFRHFLEAQTTRRWRLALCGAPMGARFDPLLELEGEGYPAGGVALEAPEVQQEGRRLYLVWPARTRFESVTVDARYAAIYEPASGEVAVNLDFGKSVSSVNGPFTVVIPRDEFVVRV